MIRTIASHGAITGAAYFRRELSRARRFAATLKTSGADVVLANNAPGPNLAAHLACRWLGLPIVQYVRAPFAAGPLARTLLRHAGAVCSVGADASELVRRAPAWRHGRDPREGAGERSRGSI